MEGQEQRKSGRRRGEVSRSERRTKANFIATESSRRALHGHTAGSLTSTTLATASSHLDGADGGCFRQPLLGNRVQHVNVKDMYVGRNSSVLNVHIQHAHLDCRGKEDHANMRRESELSSPTSCKVAPGVDFGVRCSRFSAARLAAAMFFPSALGVT